MCIFPMGSGSDISDFFRAGLCNQGNKHIQPLRLLTKDICVPNCKGMFNKMC